MSALDVVVSVVGGFGMALAVIALLAGATALATWARRLGRRRRDARGPRRARP